MVIRGPLGLITILASFLSGYTLGKGTPQSASDEPQRKAHEYLGTLGGMSPTAGPREARPREPRPFRRAHDVTRHGPGGRGLGREGFARFSLYVTVCVGAELSKCSGN